MSRLGPSINHPVYPIITHSSRHVAVVDKGVVVDSWDSRHGRCDRILVKPEDKERVLEMLINNGAL